MAWSEDDEEAQNSRYEDASSRARRGNHPDRDDSWDRDAPDEADLVPDEMQTVRCTECRKLIFEDSVRCPYCKQMQLEAGRHRKPRWFVFTAIFGLALIAAYFLVTFFVLLHWIHR